MAGLSFLRRLLMKQAMKESAPFQHEGIMSISKILSGNIDTKIKRMVESAKRQGVDLDNLSEQELKYMLEMNKPKGPTIGGHRIISGDSSEGKGITDQLIKQLERLKPKESADVFDLTGKKIDTSKPIMGGKNVPESIDPNSEIAKSLRTEKAAKKLSDSISDAEKALRGQFPKASDAEIKNMLFVNETITRIKSKKPIDAMKEANSVIARKGKYKNLTKKQSKKILKDTEDHIFERDIPDEDFAYV